MLTVLCIDDHLQCLYLRGEVLSSAGFHVLTVNNGEAGIALAEQHAVDVLVLDYSMPKMDGEEVARILKKDYPRLPIILCSGLENIPQRMFDLVDAFVRKGDDGVEFLVSTIRAVGTRNILNFDRSA